MSFVPVLIYQGWIMFCRMIYILLSTLIFTGNMIYNNFWKPSNYDRCSGRDLGSTKCFILASHVKSNEYKTADWHLQNLTSDIKQTNRVRENYHSFSLEKLIRNLIGNYILSYYWKNNLSLFETWDVCSSWYVCTLVNIAF